MKSLTSWKCVGLFLFSLVIALIFLAELYFNNVHIRFLQNSVVWTPPSPLRYTHSHPKTKIVFLKTYKTASTTVSSILMRYGYYHNLSFLLPKRNPVFSRVDRFHRRMLTGAVPPLKVSNGSYDVLAVHVPFNKPELSAVFQNATYITIIRNPATQFESTFGQYKMDTKIKEMEEDLEIGMDPLKLFLSNPRKYYNNPSPNIKSLLRNRQIFDIGLEMADFDNETRIDEVIKTAENDFDLVMITEYFDESLVLLRRILSWEFKDVAYILQNYRPEFLRFQLDDWDTQRILEWNHADDKLYQHFNATFWRKVAEYGPEFQTDLAELRRTLDKVSSDCLDKGRYKITYRDRRNDTMLKKNAPPYCKVMNWDADVGTYVLRKRQMMKG